MNVKCSMNHLKLRREVLSCSKNYILIRIHEENLCDWNHSDFQWAPKANQSQPTKTENALKKKLKNNNNNDKKQQAMRTLCCFWIVESVWETTIDLECLICVSGLLAHYPNITFNKMKTRNKEACLPLNYKTWGFLVSFYLSRLEPGCLCKWR